MVYSQLQAVMENKVQPIVRPPWNDQVMIKRFLDAGVQTLLVPMVQTVEEAEQAVASTRYPPRGVRGFASASRSSRFGRVKDYHTRCEEEICVLVQIETKQGLDNLEAIAGGRGRGRRVHRAGRPVGGPRLSRRPGQPGASARCSRTRCARIKATGKAPGILTGDEALARRCIELGCLFTAVGAELRHPGARLRAAGRQVQGHSSPT